MLDPVFFHICGESQDSVDQVKKWIDDLIAKDQYTDPISDEMLLSLPSSELQIIQDLQDKYDVKMTLSPKSQGTVDAVDASLTIEGLSRDVLVASREVQTILRKSRERESVKRQTELTSNLVQWEYSLQDQYKAFDPETNFSLEQGKEKGQRQMEVILQGQVFTVTLPDGPAVDIQGNQVKLRRRDKLGGNISFNKF